MPMDTKSWKIILKMGSIKKKMPKMKKTKKKKKRKLK